MEKDLTNENLNIENDKVSAFSSSYPLNKKLYQEMVDIFYALKKRIYIFFFVYIIAVICLWVISGKNNFLLIDLLALLIIVIYTIKIETGKNKSYSRATVSHNDGDIITTELYDDNIICRIKENSNTYTYDKVCRLFESENFYFMYLNYQLFTGVAKKDIKDSISFDNFLLNHCTNMKKRKITYVSANKKFCITGMITIGILLALCVIVSVIR